MSSEKKMKVIFLGESNVGKSSLIRRLGEDKFDADYDFENRRSRKGITEVTVSGSIFRLWDTQGEEQFQSLPPKFFKNASACVLAYDVSSKTSFNGVKAWREELERRAVYMKDGSVTVILAANKSDLQVQVDENMVKQYALDNGVILLKTSAKTGSNCSTLLDTIARASRKNRHKKSVTSKPAKVQSSTGSSSSSSSVGDGENACCVIS